MFLIEYADGNFFNAEQIDHVSICGDQVKFSGGGDYESCFIVDKDKEATFVNNLQALNQSIHNIQQLYHESKHK